MTLSEHFSSSTLYWMMASLFLIGMLGLLYYKKKFYFSYLRQEKHFKILDTLPLGNQRYLTLVSCQDNLIIVLFSPKGDHLLLCTERKNI